MGLFVLIIIIRSWVCLKHLLRIIYEEYYLEPFTIVSDQNSLPLDGKLYKITELHIHWHDLS